MVNLLQMIPLRVHFHSPLCSPLSVVVVVSLHLMAINSGVQGASLLQMIALRVHFHSPLYFPICGGGVSLHLMAINSGVQGASLLQMIALRHTCTFTSTLPYRWRWGKPSLDGDKLGGEGGKSSANDCSSTFSFSSVLSPICGGGVSLHLMAINSGVQGVSLQ